MSRSARVGRVLCLLAVLPLVAAGCGRDDLPLGVSSPAGVLDAASPTPDLLGDDAFETTSGKNHRHGPIRRVLIEAKYALGAVLTGEQAQYQRFEAYVAAADTADLRIVLGVHLEEPSRRWAFSVIQVTPTGFTAVARGRDHTRARGLIVQMNYTRGEPLAWSVRRFRH